LRDRQMSPNVTVRDTVVYSILPGEWPKVKAHLTYELNEKRR
ncbi:MAG: GCN5-related N-acetyltransferase, partial [Burkholderiales bacterium]|nr:GCN5-related N-acetyltransferase [Burkholderiales bacterium]